MCQVQGLDKEERLSPTCDRLAGTGKLRKQPRASNWTMTMPCKIIHQPLTNSTCLAHACGIFLRDIGWARETWSQGTTAHLFMSGYDSDRARQKSRRFLAGSTASRGQSQPIKRRHKASAEGRQTAVTQRRIRASGCPVALSHQAERFHFRGSR